MLRKILSQIVTCLLISLLLAGCSEDKSGFNEKEEMLIQLIMDMHVAEAAMGKVPDKYKDSLRLTYRSEIARLHNLETSEMDHVLLEIQDDPVEYQKLTMEAMLRLDSIERSLH